MKTQIIKNILIAIILSISCIYVQAQSCTQCDNFTSPSGSYASEIGQNTTANGTCSFAGGVNSVAQDNYSFAFGNTAQALSPHSFALGGFTKANGASAFALGNNCTSNGSSSFVLGEGLNSSNLLINSISHSLMIGFKSDQPTFFVGESTGVGYTGKIGIGNVTSPQAKLHIKADGGEAVDLLLEAGNSAATARLKFGITASSTSPNRIEASQEGDLNFHTASEYVFWDGNVGINNYNPAEKLDVNGNIKTTGFILADGQQAANKILQSDANGMATWVDPMALNVDDGDWVTAAYSDNIYRLNGNVGIGTTNPLSRFEVTDSYGKMEFNNDQLNISSLYSGYSPSLKLTNSNGDFWQIKNDYSASDFEIYNNTSKLFSIATNGDVMIGNNSP
jgi:hypothetical protein